MSLITLLINNPKILKNIQLYLAIQDVSNLVLINRAGQVIFQNSLQDHINTFLHRFMDSIEIHLQKQIFKKSKTQNKQQQKKEKQPKLEQEQPQQTNNKPNKNLMLFKNSLTGGYYQLKDNSKLLKLQLKDIPKQLFCGKTWKMVTYESAIGFLNQVDQNQFESLENANKFFISNDDQYIVSINRSLIDPTLNELFQLEYIDEEETIKSQLEKISMSNDFDASNYDLTNMQEILARQKKILGQIGIQKQITKIKVEENNQASIFNLYKLKQYAIILCAGGYFSIGVYDHKGQCILHKSDHKYVKRSKQGQRQLNADSSSGRHIQSVGSQIRRDQEKKHQMNVSTILNDAFDVLEKCDILLLQAPGINQQLLVTEEEPLFKLKHKLRSLCITSKKANYTEVERIQKTINKVIIVKRNKEVEEEQLF